MGLIKRRNDLPRSLSIAYRSITIETKFLCCESNGDGPKGNGQRTGKIVPSHDQPHLVIVILVIFTSFSDRAMVAAVTKSPETLMPFRTSAVSVICRRKEGKREDVVRALTCSQAMLERRKWEPKLLSCCSRSR
jgi:hypothetical protein